MKLHKQIGPTQEENDVCAGLFVAASPVISEEEKQPSSSAVKEEQDKLWCIYIMGCKKKKNRNVIDRSSKHTIKWKGEDAKQCVRKEENKNV